MKIKTDTEFASLIPPLLQEDFVQLEKNLLSDGCLDPLIVWNGLLLDGHNRLKICDKHGLRYEVKDISLPDRDAAKEWIITHQLGRRNLTMFQRAELALKLEPILAKMAKEKQQEHGGTAPGKTLVQNSAQVNDKHETRTNVKLAKAAGVSHDTIHKVKVIEKEADEETKEALRIGEKSIGSAYREIKEKKEDEKPKKKQPLPKPGPPCIGMQFARLAIMRLEEITVDDIERQQAFSLVKEWINEHE